MTQRVPYRRLAGFYFFYFAYLGTFAPFFSLYLESVGLTPFDIGVVMALPQLTRIIAPHLWSWLADRSTAPVRVVRLTGLVGTAVFLAVFAATRFSLLFAVIFAMTFFWSAALPLMEATTLSHLGDETARYGRIRVWGSVGFIAAVIGVGHLLDIVRLDAVPILVLAMMLGMLVCSWLVPESPTPHHRDGETVSVVLFQPHIIALIAAGAFMSAAHGPYYTFFSIYLVAEGYSKAATGWLWALGVACEIGIFMWMPRLYRAFTLRQILIASFACAVIRFVAIGWFAQMLPVLVIAQTLHAATFGAFHAASIGYVHRYFKGRLQSRGQALYGSLAFGVGGAFGAFASGALWERAGAGLTFSFGAACALVGGAIFARWSAPETVSARRVNP
ncbi:MAG: transporter, family, 3-phenylpropionic acid transporter [Betaproteobacteria bacterium]